MRTAKSPADIPSQTEALSMSGLEFVEKMLSGDLVAPPIAETLSFFLHRVEKGCTVFRGTPEFAHANPMGGLHGGWYATILDSCMACAVMSMLPQGSTYTTLEFKVNITRAIPLGMLVEATGTVQHFGRSTGVAIGEVRGVENGKLYATGSTTCLVMRP